MKNNLRGPEQGPGMQKEKDSIRTFLKANGIILLSGYYLKLIEETYRREPIHTISSISHTLNLFQDRNEF